MVCVQDIYMALILKGQCFYKDMEGLQVLYMYMYMELIM